MAIPSNTVNCWDEAFDRVPKDTKQWHRFCKIVRRNSIPGYTFTATAAIGASSLSLSAPTTADELSHTIAQLKSVVDAKDVGKIRSFFRDAISVLSNVQASLSTIATANPYAAAGWGVVSFLISAANKHVKIKDFCWQRLVVVASLVHKYQTYQEVYLDDDAVTTSRNDMRSAMIVLFEQIFQFQICCVIAVESRLERLKTAFRDNVTSQLSIDIEAQEAHLNDLQMVITQQTSKIRHEQLIRLTSALTSSIMTQFDSIEIKLMDLKASVDSDRRHKVLHWLSPIPYERIHRKENKTPIADTGGWLMRDQRYIDWLYAPSDAVLWLHGKLGSGKSCVTHAVIEHLKLRVLSDPTECLVFFYCDRTDADGRKDMGSVENMLRSFLKQIADSSGRGTLDRRLNELYDSDKPKGPLSATECVAWISRLAANLNLMIVVDGLDESDINIQHQLMNYLKLLILDTNHNIRIYIASRDEIAIRRGLNILKATKMITINIASENEASIDEMIDIRIASAIDSSYRYLYIDDDTGDDQSLSTRMTLKAHANGMFQWVVSAVAYLHASESYHDMTDRLNAISRVDELEMLYCEIYLRTLEKARKAKNETLLKVILLFALHGYRMDDPVLDILNEPTLYIRQACSYLKTGSFSRNYTDDDLLNICQSLLCRNTGNNSLSLSFPHASVADFLRNTYDEFSEESGHGHLAAFCMNVFVNFERNFPKITDFGLVDTSYIIQESVDANMVDAIFRRETMVAYAARFWSAHAHRSRQRSENQRRLADRPYSGVQSLGIAFDFGSALHSFILCDVAPKPFVIWHGWSTENLLRPRTRNLHPSSTLLTYPCSTIFARAALGLDIEYQLFAQRGLLEVDSQPPGAYIDTGASSQTTLGFAVRHHINALFEGVLQHGIPRIGRSDLIGLIRNAELKHRVSGTSAAFVPHEALRKLIDLSDGRSIVYNVSEGDELHLLTPSMYLLYSTYNLEILEPMLRVFFESGLSPTFEDHFTIPEFINDWRMDVRDQHHRRRVEGKNNNGYPHTSTRSLLWHISNYVSRNSRLALGIQEALNPLMLEFVKSEDLDQMLFQAAQAGNANLVSVLMDKGADPSWVKKDAEPSILCSLYQAINAAGNTMQHAIFVANKVREYQRNHLRFRRHGDHEKLHILRYQRTISTLSERMLRKNFRLLPCVKIKSCDGKGFEIHNFLLTIVRCCEVETVSHWIEKTDYPILWLRESECDSHHDGEGDIAVDKIRSVGPIGSATALEAVEIPQVDFDHLHDSISEETEWWNSEESCDQRLVNLNRDLLQQVESTEQVFHEASNLVKRRSRGPSPDRFIKHLEWHRQRLSRVICYLKSLAAKSVPNGEHAT